MIRISIVSQGSIRRLRRPLGARDNGGGGYWLSMSCNPIARISNSQNGVVYYPSGLASCICSGGNGHDASYPYIVEVFEI